MPKKKATPLLDDRAAEIYKEKYQDAYASKDPIYPHMRGLLLQLAKVEAQFEWLAKMDRDAQEKGEDIFLVHAEGKEPYAHPHRKLEKELRSSQNKIIKALNLSMEKKAAMKAEAADSVASIVSKMK